MAITGLGGFAARLQETSPMDLALRAGTAVVLCLIAWVAILAIGRPRAAAIRRLLRHTGVKKTEKAIRFARILRLCELIMDGAIVFLAVFTICQVWGLDVGAWLWRGDGRVLVQFSFRTIVVVVGAAAAWEAAEYLIGKALERLRGGLVDMRRTAQIDTLGPLLRRAAQVAILTLAGLMLLSDLGVRIGPLLAGAGVVGIAIGFGAQTVVRDLLTGLFLLMEDVLAVGDVVRIGDSGGLVEAMTLRTIRLRDFDGALHIIPYGQAQVVHNLTKTFSCYVFELQVSYGSDIDKALGIMRQTGDGMQEDPAFHESILEPIEVVGVDNLADSGVVLKARIKTKPMQQWTVGREYNRRIKLAFDRHGIEIPFPHVKVVLPERQLRMMAGEQSAGGGH